MLSGARSYAKFIAHRHKDSKVVKDPENDEDGKEDVEDGKEDVEDGKEDDKDTKEEDED
jgi:hypothetical protein